MRQMMAMAGVVALAACGGPAEDDNAASGQDAAATATPAAGATPSETPAPVAAKGLELTSKGLVAGAEAFLFEAGRNEVETALTKLIGEPEDRNEVGECGAGPMEFTDYAGGITANFQEGKLVGWNWRSPNDGDAATSVEIVAEGPAQLGTARAAVEAADGYEVFEDSTLGDEFAIGDLFGFFEEGEVSMLYAGTQCFFR